MINFKMRGVLVVIGLLAFLDGSAQNFLSNNWYFGTTGRGIRFNRTDNTPTLVTGAALITGGSAVATSPLNGNVLFYTDGARVFNISNTQFASGLNGNTTSNQPVAISALPGQPNRYLIFTNTASYTTGGTISVSTVDMTLAGPEPFPTPPLGNVVLPVNNPTGLTGRSEAMITVPHDNGTDFWLITHENGTDNYTATLVEAGPVFTHNTFTNVTSLPISAANFSYHAASGKIAVSPQTEDDNVAILNFDNATGTITFDQFVFNSSVASTNTQATYDTEWSTSGRFLYISRHGEPGIAADVLQFDLNNISASLASVLPTPVNRSYGLQIAPDSSIYHIYETGGIFHVARLSDIDSVATDVIYTPDAFGPINFGGRQFSSFAPWSMLDLTVTFTAAATCSPTDYFANSPISFYPTVSPGADSLVWTFGDGTASSQWSPIHTYQNNGIVNVEVIAYLNGDTSRFDLDLNLLQFDLQLTLVADTTACRCEFPAPVGTACNGGPFEVTVQAQGGVSPSFLWSNGDTGATLTPDSAGYYYVVATDGGCSAYAAVNVREYDATDQRANIWYFGNLAGIDFNTPPGRRSIPGPINTPEGVSVISDRNGQVLFSTDGVNVYDRNDALIATNIGGEQDATQAALIVPVPGDETLYYIFTTQAVHGTYTYELRYSLYDIKLNGGDGGLAETLNLLLCRSRDRMRGDGGWVSAHEYGNNSFRAYPVGPDGIGNPVISSAGSDHLVTDEFNGRGYMELGQGQVVVALPSFSVSNFLEFFDFDAVTGEISNFRQTNLNATAQQVYGVEIIGDKIFATLSGSPNSFLRELYFDFQGNPVLIPPGAASGPFANRLGAIQAGPDGEIYVAVNNQAFLGTIQVNPDTLQLSAFTMNGFALTTGTSTLGLPNFIQNVGTAISPPGMTITGFCEGSPTSFTGSGTDPIDEFLWSFGDGFSSDSSSVQHTYPITGVPTNYLVTLQITNRCGLDTLLSRTITIYPPPDNPTFLPPGVPQAVLCSGPLTLEAEPSPGTTGYTYDWSTGETTRSILVTRQSVVDVTITSAQGCTSNGTILVADNRPQVNLGPDQTICQDAAAVAVLNAQNPGANFQWFVSAITNGPAIPNGNTTQTQPVNTGVIGNFEYKVEVLDPITLCRVRDSLVFTINESPAFNALVTPPAACGLNGQIALEILSPASRLFSYYVNGALTDTDVPTGPVLPVLARPAGTYVIEVEDQLSGCATTQTRGISDITLTVTAAALTPTCDPVVLNVQTNVTIFTGATYTITGVTTGALGPFPFSAANFPSIPVPVPDSYTIQINAQGCVATFDLDVVSDPQTVVSFAPISACPTQVTALPAGAVSYNWSASDPLSIVGATNTQTVTLDVSAPRTWNLSVTVNDGVNCPGTATTTVSVGPAFTASISQSDACENQVTLSATPVGAFTYQWTDPGGAPIPGGSSIVVSTSGLYAVRVQSTLTGCFSTANLNVFVAGDLQLGMTTTIPCQGSPFVLTGTANIAGTNLQWSVNGNNIGTGPTLPRTTGGLYRLTGTLPGCTEFIEQQISLFPVTPGSLPSRALICNKPENPDCILDPASCLLTLDAGPNFTSYTWSTGETTQTIIVGTPDTYIVNLVNSYGCTSTDQTQVLEECKPIIKAPTAFRPGSSITDNSSFYLFTYFVSAQSFQLFIYNRWGELVYQSNGLDDVNTTQSKRWNGGYNNDLNKQLPGGTYTYVVKYKSEYRDNGPVQELRGGVVLLR